MSLDNTHMQAALKSFASIVYEPATEDDENEAHNGEREVDVSIFFAA